MDPKQVEFDFPGMRICGLRFNEGAQHKVLAVHGWLDNANSFLPLMPLLPDVDLVAIDLPGHGHSAHLEAGAVYHFSDIPYWFFEIAGTLKWPEFHLLGHSLGACLAPFAAIANPDAIQSLMMLEATGPLSEPASSLPERVKRSYQDRAAAKLYKPRKLASTDQGVDARQLATRMERHSAELLIERQLIETEDGSFTWRYDSRHRHASAAYMVEEQVLEVLAAITCPVLLVVSKNGYMTSRSQTEKRFHALKKAERIDVPGHHHMHMDDPEPTALAINNFLAKIFSNFSHQ